MTEPTSNRAFLWLKIAAASVFAGRAYQHIFWDAPYRELLWDDQLMKPVIEALTPWNWHEFVTNLAVDEAVQHWMLGIGTFYAFCAVACFFYEKMPKWVRWPIWLGVAGQVVLALLYMKEYFLHVGQFFEYALQFCAPAFLIVYFRREIFSPRLIFAMKLATALTFICHGLYAVGYYPRPGVFMSMTMKILGCSETLAGDILTVAGWMDFVVAIGIFLPIKWSRWFLLYAVVWGLLTSFARIFGNFYWDFPLQSLHEWAFQTVYRLPHGLIPLVLFGISQSSLTSLSEHDDSDS
ncbi:MAG: hypothetical protein K9J37_04840 [Saprospiraceae bacterium]|nr:hypothetical protein [Saprospiraceae bacterium]MCF8249213.1 hypothetical protein [Saprospiraceae bacterium]MCF8280180.1 hypothetical protein [Bacteroidales bacterium]MCF8311342.1 hypothetical protein [Saprospiraceae bacterium]MCF8440094.1 hypothetical protein [Saprospiraceae bacterium]